MIVWLERGREQAASRRAARRARRWLEELEPRLVLATITVTTLNDVNVDGDGLLSLREAIAIANSPGLSIDGFTSNDVGDDIVFQPDLNGTLALLAGQLTVSQDLSITGNGATATLIDAQQSSRIFDVTSSAGDLSLSRLTLRNGKTMAAGQPGGAIRFLSDGGMLSIDACIVTANGTEGTSFGGAIFTDQGDLSINASTISGNTTLANSASGGAIFSWGGTLRITNSVLHGNSTSGEVAYGGAIASLAGSLTIINSTISGNSTAATRATGGGLALGSSALQLINSTVVDNSAPESKGGGIYSDSGPVSLSNSILSGNADDGTAPELYRKQTSGLLTIQSSLIGNNTGTGLTAALVGLPDANGNLIGTAANPIDPLLGPLSDNGGPTQTRALLLASPALNAGSNALATDPGPDGVPGNGDDVALTTDQRGAGFARIIGGTVDMGAFEIQDLVPPQAPTVNALLTNDTTPTLTGTWDNSDATVLEVTVGGVTHSIGANLTTNGANWTLNLDGTTPLAAGTYDVMVHTEDATGNSADDATTNELTIDTTPPGVPTVNPLVTNDTTPTLTGTWDSAGASILEVTVNGRLFTLAASEIRTDVAGNWSLNLNGTPNLPDGTYNVAVHTADAAGNVQDDATTNELTVDTAPPAAPTVNFTITNDITPTVNGTWDIATATLLQVTVNGTTFTRGTNPQLTSTPAGVWTLNLNGETPLPEGTYNVLVHTADLAGNTADDTSTNELRVDVTAPTLPTVMTQVTNDTTPILAGTWDSVDATILQVSVNGTTYTLGQHPELSASGNTWTLDLSNKPPFSEGTFSLTAHTADVAGNASDDTTSNELTVDTTPPGISTVNGLLSNDTTPTLSGTWDNATASGLSVTVLGIIYTLGTDANLTTSGNTWSLNLDGTPALSEGFHNVTVQTADAAGNQTSDQTADELEIDTHVYGDVAAVLKGSKLTLTGKQPGESYTLEIRFTPVGVTLTGNRGTTINGQQTLVLNPVKTVRGALGDGDDTVRVEGNVKGFQLSLGGGQNSLTLEDFTATKAAADSAGDFRVEAIDSVFGSLALNSGVAADVLDLLRVEIGKSAKLDFGGGSNTITVNDSTFRKAVRLSSAGNASSVQIEANPPNGLLTRFLKKVSLTLGGSSSVELSRDANSDQTLFAAAVTISAQPPIATLRQTNASFASSAKLTNVDIL